MENRLPVARIALLVILIGLGLRVIQIAAGEPPLAQAAPPSSAPALAALQAEAVQHGLLAAYETLRLAAPDMPRGCIAAIETAGPVRTGWLCLDERGLSRLTTGAP